MPDPKPRPRKRFIKRFLIASGVFIIVLLSLHFWFVHNAKTVLKQYIAQESKGKIKLELRELNISFLSNRLQIHEADLVSTDSVKEPITYHVTFNELSLKVGSVWALLFQKKLYLDSLHLQDPVVEIMQWRKNTTQKVARDELSIPQEMGKLYNSLLEALNEFGVRRVIIDNAKVSLINKMNPQSVPVTMTNIFFDLSRTAIKKGNKNIYLKKDQTVVLRTNDQTITLPGGRHKISFKSFKLQLFRERIDLDSCTVTAAATDSVKSNYSIFFKKLALTGVDFNAMSAFNVIKADSVYCEEPMFDFNLYRSDAVKKKTALPDADKIVKELTGNLNLAFVGVKNAGIHIDINGKTKRSFFNSNKDNFEMRGFRINPDSSQPVSITRFDMTLRDYHLYNEDSSSSYSFDSLHFLNSKVVLSNFAIVNKPGSGRIKNNIEVRVPYFELTQLNWYELIFNQNMVAKQAVLNNPIINFTRRAASTQGKKINLFTSLQNLDSLVALENVTVINGQVNMQLGSTTSFNVENIDFNIYSNKLLGSTTKEGLRSAVEHLSFAKGVLRLKDITAQLQNARFTDGNLLYADKISISGKENKIVGVVNNVHINNMQLDDDAETIDVDGLGWKSASLAMKGLPASTKKGKGNGSSINLRNLAGNNTQLNISNKGTVISTFIQDLNAASLSKKGDDLRVEGFVVAGNDLLVNSKGVTVNAANYRVNSNNPSFLSNVRVQQISGRDSLDIKAEQVNFTTDLNLLFANDIQLTNVMAQAPVIKLVKWDTATNSRETPAKQIPIRINALKVFEPTLTISTHLHDSVTTINIPWSANSTVDATGIVIAKEGMQLGTVKVKTTAATYSKTSGEMLGVEDGKIDIDLSAISLGKRDGKTTWSGFINNFSIENAKGLQLGKAKNKLRFQKASVGNVNLSSAFLPDFDQLMKANLTAWLHIPQGELIDSNTTLKWYNANYTNSRKTLTLDSFIYHPTRPIDSVIKYAPYELDYITFKSGAIKISGLDATSYEKDSSIIASSIKVSDPVLTVYRDKFPPSNPIKRAKELPVDMLKKIKLPVAIDSVIIEEGTITYSEKNGVSRKEGGVLLTNVFGLVQHIKNSNFLPDDSLSVTMTARLMDSAQLTVSVKESYVDTLSGFLLKAKVGSADLSILNAVLVPIANVKIAAGTLDSVTFSAVGRKDVSYGKMDLHYNKLKVKLIKDGDPNQSTFMQKTLSFIANTFLIKSSNSKRTGLMFFERTFDQPFINYIIKTTLSGLITSVGVKSNRKYNKQYKQQLKQSNNPPINL